MPYRVSAARRRFDVQMRDLQGRVLIASPTSIDPVLREFSISAGVFLAHAEFENYFVDFLDGVAKTCVFAGVLPNKLRAHLFFNSFGVKSLAEKVSSGVGEASAYAHIEQKVDSSAVVFVDSAKPFASFVGRDIFGDFGYPSQRNIEKVLKRLGMNSPKIELDKAVKRDVFSLLKSVSDLRTSLAHSASIPGLSCEDVVARIESLKVVAQAIDRAVYSNLVPLVKDRSWVAGMA
jgi:hypothetical protein